ncbi:hypothetical protein DFH06DRAFT_1219737 [Mycena polygramma]|nr:hypothetical protein DFH06DRAFT_1219737 [Mycena polygramma]
MGPVAPHQPVVQPQPQRQPVPANPPPATPAPVPRHTQTPFAGGAFAQQVPQVPQQPAGPQPSVQERANPDIAHVLQPLPTPNPAVFGPPPPQQPLPPLRNPLPAPPRDLYELSPYKNLLSLPQTAALLTAVYDQPGGVPPPSYGQRRGNKTGGLLRALTGRGRKEEEVQYVPVFIKGQRQPPPQQFAGGAGVGAPTPAPAAAGPTVTRSPSFASQNTPHFPVPQQNFSEATPRTQRRPPLRFSSSTPEYSAFLNYSPYRIVYNNVEYPTAMHLHEAMKYTNPDFVERIRSCPDVAQVYPLSEQLSRTSPESVRPDWSSMYLSTMEQVVLEKFRQHANLRHMLTQTEDAPLIYADPEDSYWGEGPPGQEGLNHLGHLLERVRAQLRQEGGLPPLHA